MQTETATAASTPLLADGRHGDGCALVSAPQKGQPAVATGFECSRAACLDQGPAQLAVVALQGSAQKQAYRPRPRPLALPWLDTRPRGIGPLSSGF